MSTSGPHDILAFAAPEPRHLAEDTVLVADQLLPPGLPAIDCPAAPLLAGELRRQGVRVTRGPLPLGPTDRTGRPTSALAAVLSGTSGRVGLGVAAANAAAQR